MSWLRVLVNSSDLPSPVIPPKAIAELQIRQACWQEGHPRLWISRGKPSHAHPIPALGGGVGNCIISACFWLSTKPSCCVLWGLVLFPETLLGSCCSLIPLHHQGNPPTPSQNDAEAPSLATWAAPHLFPKSSVNLFSPLLLPACTGTNRAVTCHPSNLSAERQNRQTLRFCSAATI